LSGYSARCRISLVPLTDARFPGMSNGMVPHFRGNEALFRMNKKKGFTLIELLVVIAIIAILAAILFPVFIKAKQKAWQTTCCSHGQQLGRGFSMYGNDWGGRFPNCNEWADPGKTKCRLFYVLSKYISGNFELFKCPADTGERLIGGSDLPFWKGQFTFYSSWAWPSTYCSNWVNGLPQDHPWPSTGPRSGTDKLPLSKRPVVFDGRPWHWGTQGNDWTNIPGKCTVLFCDYHVKMTTYNAMLSIMGGTPPPGF